MLEIASLIVINLLIAFAIGTVFGYVIAKGTSYKEVQNDNPSKNKTQSKRFSNSGVNPIFKKSSNLDNKPLVISSPKPSGKDNLKKIKGITNKIENDLNTLGIYHFEQIASWSSKNCDWIESFLLEPGCAKNNQWVEQAKILKSGKETIYSQKVENGEINVG
jgi:predicted flap endonuclease-1-like 5' DNA nuclease